MADEEAYEAAVRVMQQAPEVDALVVSVVPMTPRLQTTPRELATPGASASLAERVPRWAQASAKPLIFVVDAGPLYDALAQAVRASGVPVFRSADQAIRSLGYYLHRRAAR
jgi:acyl-CoA synthetase (NDP forming)